MSAALANLPFGTEETLARLAHLWREAGKASLPQAPSSATLLRLAVLRDVYRALHAHKSRCLATGMKEEARALKSWETRLEALKIADLSVADNDLFAALESEQPLKKRARVIPQGLFQHIEKEKFERYDRTWENALAAEASSVGWRFWRLESWVLISGIEAWNQRLTEQLWPDGIVLFVESAGFQESATGNPQDARWQGQWVITLNPRFRTAGEISLDLATWSGYAGSAPTWKAIYTPPAPPQKIASRG